MLQPLKSPHRFRFAELCPCGKSNKDGKFVPYILNGKPSANYGFCHSCGKTFLPDKKQEDFKTQPLVAPVTKPIKYVDKEIILQTLKHYDNNNFVSFLSEFSNRDNIVNYFHIGTAKGNGTIFWYQDIGYNFRTGKLIFYLTDGHRDKSKPIKSLFTKDKGFEPCLFGEFQLNFYDKDTTVILVESEKTAVLGRLKMPKYVWLATGGSNGLTYSKAKVLKNRNIIIIPDCDTAGRSSVERNLVILKSIGCRVEVLDLKPELNDGSDVADFITEQTF